LLLLEFSSSLLASLDGELISLGVSVPGALMG
jgi:hypothetical protein